MRLRRGTVGQEAQGFRVDVGRRRGPGVQGERCTRFLPEAGRRGQRGQEVPHRVRLGRVHAVRAGDDLLRAGATVRLEGVEDGALRAAAHQQQHEGVLVQQPGDLVAERRRVPAVVPGAAVALRFQVAEARQQVDARARGVLHEVGRHVVVEQRRHVPGPLDREVEEAVPLSVGQPLQQDVGPVGRAVPVPDDRGDAPRSYRHRADRPRAREPAARLHLRRVHRRVLQGLQPGPAPPAPRETPAVRGRQRGERPLCVLVVPGHRVPPRSSTSSASSASVSSVRADSPVPRTASASSRLRCSSAAMRSSTVPSATSRCTCTGRV